MSTERTVPAALLQPSSVAIVGASGTEGSLGSRPLSYLLRHGFSGSVYPVNPRQGQLDGLPAFASLRDVPKPVDLVVVCVPARAVPEVLADCEGVGASCVVVLSSGFAETGPDGRALEAQVLDAARRHGLRLLGPNSEGLYAARERVALTFSPALDGPLAVPEAADGGIAIISQSGGLGFSPLTESERLGLDIRYVVSTGNEADIDSLAVADYMLRELQLQVIVLIVEELPDPTRVGPLGQLAREKDVELVAVKLGASPSGARAVASHTGHDAGDDASYEQLFAEHGITRARDQSELLDVLSVFSRGRRMAGRRVGIVTSSGGAGIWLADACEAAGLQVPELSPQAQQRLADLMPGYGSAVNPVDITAQAVAHGLLVPAVEAVAASGEVDAVLIATSLAAAGRLEREREALAGLVADCGLPFGVFTYTAPDPSNTRLLAALGIPWFPTPQRAANGLAALARRPLLQTGTSSTPELVTTMTSTNTAHPSSYP